MSSATPMESNGKVDVVKDMLDSIINSVVILHSKNTPRLSVLPSPLSLSTADATTATNTTIDASQSAARIPLEIPAQNQPVEISLEIPAHVPMSEEIGESLFAQGYDSDGLLAEYFPESDLNALEDYSKIEIGTCQGDTAPELAPATDVPKFVLITDNAMKKLKVDELRRELKDRGLGVGGLKKDLQDRLKKAMQDKVPIETAVTREAAPSVVFGEGVYWKKLVPMEEPIFDPTESTEYHAPTEGADEVSVVKKRNFSETFDRQPFIAYHNVDILDRYKRRKLHPQTKKIMQEKKRL